MKGWVLRREFDTDEGAVARWWGTDGYGEPEDAVVHPTRLVAEEEHRAVFGPLEHCERAQRLTDALAEVSGGLGVPPGRGMKRGSSDGTTSRTSAAPVCSSTSTVRSQ